MIRARFKTNGLDPRPVIWPIKHPFWVTGHGDDYAIIVAYADNIEEVKANWPDARDIDHGQAEEYVFTDRFPKPDWFDVDRTQDAIDFFSTHPVIGHNFNEIYAGIEGAQDLCHALATHSGWWEGVNPNDPYVFGTKMALVHSEVSEALEGGRKNKMDDHLPHRRAEEVELADAVIRIFDLAGARRLDIAGAMIEKLAYNQRREDHKRQNRVKPGGKGF